MTTTKREVEFTLRKIRGDLEKTESECNFYKSSQAETSALLRSKDVELAAAERELAKVLSKKEALEMQIMDKEEVS